MSNCNDDNNEVDTTYSAVIRHCDDHRRVLAESSDWNTRRDAETLGVNALTTQGWIKVAGGVLCIEARRSST
jgi:hypothetical protein